MDAVWQLYKQTVFLLEQPLNSQLSFAIITAYNPQGQQCNLGYNHSQDNKLQADIDILGCVYRKLWGCSPALDYAEKSWMISTDKTTAIKLAEKYQQNALYWVEQGELLLLPCLLKMKSEESIGAFDTRCFYQQANCCI